MNSLSQTTTAVETPTQRKLHGKWDLYYHLPHDKKWDLASYKKIQGGIDSVETLISINEHMPESIMKYCMLFVMREGITPMWEDPKNRNGGCFSFKILNKQVPQVWKSLFYALCGESLCVNREYASMLNGITISPKKNFCIVKIWMDNSRIQDPSVIIPIVNLPKQGCLFKKHEPEF